MQAPKSHPQNTCDVAIVGGALSGAATAWLLLRRNPNLRVAILECRERFDRRGSESLCEIGRHFLESSLDLADHLNEQPYARIGPRYWFNQTRRNNLEIHSEHGECSSVRLPGGQIDHAELGEELLARVVNAGARLLRPVHVTDVTLEPGGHQTITWKRHDGSGGVEVARWVVDASGDAALLARKYGWLTDNAEHPIASCWSRWTGVKNGAPREFGETKSGGAAPRPNKSGDEVHHFVGHGWSARRVPLDGGDVGVDLVFDQRVLDFSPGAELGDRVRSLLLAHPGAREALANTDMLEDSVRMRGDLARSSCTMAGDGYALVGSAAGFIDPLYSPAVDWIAYTVSAAAALIEGGLCGCSCELSIAEYNERFTTSYARWFEAFYKDKYVYWGDAELMRLSLRLDIGLRHLGACLRLFQGGRASLENPLFSDDYAYPAYQLIAFYNRRLASMARARARREIAERSALTTHLDFRDYESTWALPWRLLGAFAAYTRLELLEGWRSWFWSPVAIDHPMHSRDHRAELVRETAAVS